MRTLGAVASLVLVLLAAGLPAGEAQAAPAAQELLSVSGELTYDVRPADSPVVVTWQVTVTNNDPNTAFSTAGFIQFYQGIGLPVLRGATSLSATGPGGVPLVTGLEDPEDGVLQAATIQFDRNLFFGETYSFTLVYELSQVQSEYLLVSANYAFLPAISLGTSTVRVLTPSGVEWDVALEDGGECATPEPQVYDCRGNFEFAQLAAVVEVSRPNALASRSTGVELQRQTISVTIRHFPGQEAWADHAVELAEAAMPVLEELFGFAYDGPRMLEISQSGQRGVFGYEGVFFCETDECNIDVLPLAVDHVLLHELAHMWTTEFTDRWLAEGFAEFMARRAGSQLGGLVAGEDPPPFEAFVDLQLDSWGPTSYFLNATEEQRQREISGYALAVDFVGELEAEVGLGALQEAGAAAHERGFADSRLFFDLLEDASGRNLETLFSEWAFLPNTISLLEERRATRERLAELEAAVEEADLELQARIPSLTNNWKFDLANEVMLDAEFALDLLTNARDEVEASRSVWQRIGLIGADPEQDLRFADAAFNRGDYTRSSEHARDAVETIDGASRAGILRLVGALGALAVAAIVLGLAGFAIFRPGRLAG